MLECVELWVEQMIILVCGFINPLFFILLNLILFKFSFFPGRLQRLARFLRISILIINAMKMATWSAFLVSFFFWFQLS